MKDIAKIVGYGTFAFLLIVIGYVTVQAITMPARTAVGVAERTLDPGNVIRTYELFHDRWTGFEARVRQIQATKRMLDAEPAGAERNRLRIELSAQQQSCRDIAAAYNADATKTNREIFRGRSAPESLDMTRCE